MYGSRGAATIGMWLEVRSGGTGSRVSRHKESVMTHSIGVGRLRLLAAIVVATSILQSGGSAAARTSGEHCFTPGGADLNQLHGTDARIVAPFCREVLAGERWIPAAAWVANSHYEVLPAGYVPAAPYPIEDFNAKFVRARYVIDRGSRQERSWTFLASEVVREGLTYPGTDLPMSALIAVLRPLPVGRHSADIFVTMSADHWDGFGDDPAVDLVRAGETHWASVSFTVRPSG
ncbi:MAG TPA: hypothetical protein VNE62_04210 [Actinomycetota bacterium]|nr:hypothetical protein [Actinomycetota bacterium]